MIVRPLYEYSILFKAAVFIEIDFAVCSMQQLIYIHLVRWRTTVIL